MADAGYNRPGRGLEAFARTDTASPILKTYSRLRTLRHWLDGANGSRASVARFDLAYRRIASLEDDIFSLKPTGPFDIIAKVVTATMGGLPLDPDDQCCAGILMEAATLLEGPCSDSHE